ncbi:polyisoprenoid-binding protein [Streptomyces alboflavus]|uniref:Polyisoprenoid-binding protein n=1 Tax=Streptomyces alboflavus TaxID=67267 RepID=A0A1Z1W2P7_9ACTN|nr:YceI family protein [Streptomyces alboflavus]ARX80686.1 polyisoprenoid-binding protein [Streptomyces alboflavus]
MTTTPTPCRLTGAYVLDTTRTRIGFAARHTIGPKVRGQFDEFTGRAYLDGDDPSKSRVELTIWAASVRTGNPQRDKLLRDRFLRTDDHPAMAFATTAVRQITQTAFVLTGDLTIRGKTGPVTLHLERAGTEHDPAGTNRLRLRGGATLNRKAWGLRSPAAAGLIRKEVTLELDVTVNRRPC